MTHLSATHPFSAITKLPDWRPAALVFILTLCAVPLAFAQVSISPSENTVVVDDAPEMEVFSYGKTVIVKQRAKGVLAFGGDIIVEGSVDGDVAAIGGNVIQKEGAFIGGDVIILGGKYKPESAEPLRTEGKETVMVAGYEEELKRLAQDPTEIFAPGFSWSFLAQRTLSVLFWFLVSLGLTTIAPGAVSRAIARFNLSMPKVIGLGLAGLLLTTIGVIGGASVLPSYLSAIVGLMAFALLMLAYVFGRVALHLSVGKAIQKWLTGAGGRSETVAILFGVVFWTLLLSVPFVWTLALVALFSAGIGLVLTARGNGGLRTR
ncbi:MAG: hypothetical protein ABI539_03565 [Acidobacteriota bacterium]